MTQLLALLTLFPHRELQKIDLSSEDVRVVQTIPIVTSLVGTM